MSPNVIASAARQSRSRIDQRCRQLPIAPNVIASAARQSRSRIDQRRRQLSIAPNVIATAAWQSRSRIDQRRRQLSIVPQCHCERSVAIAHPHRLTLSPASDRPTMSLRPQRGNLAATSTNAVASFRLSPNVIASAARQSRSRIDQRRRQIPVCLQMSLRAQRGNLVATSTKISDTRPFHHRVASQYPVSSQAIRMAKRALVSPLPDPSSRIRQRVSGSTANFVGICNAVACPSPFNSPDRSAQHGGCHHRPMPRHPSPTCGSEGNARDMEA